MFFLEDLLLPGLSVHNRNHLLQKVVFKHAQLK